MTAKASAHVHGAEPVLRCGPEPSEAAAGLVMLHGRGGSAADIAALTRFLPTANIALRVPQARANTWYPCGFMAPMADNEPSLSSAILRVNEVVNELVDSGLPRDRVVLLGFSQGACLVTEFAARNAGRYGALVSFTGGLIGPPGTPRRYGGSLAGTPVFLGSADPDPHVPWQRVEETATVMSEMGAVVDARRYPGMGHTVNAEELKAAGRLLSALGGEEER